MRCRQVSRGSLALIKERDYAPSGPCRSRERRCIGGRRKRIGRTRGGATPAGASGTRRPSVTARVGALPAHAAASCHLVDQLRRGDWLTRSSSTAMLLDAEGSCRLSRNDKEGPAFRISAACAPRRSACRGEVGARPTELVQACSIVAAGRSAGDLVLIVFTILHLDGGDLRARRSRSQGRRWRRCAPGRSRPAGPVRYSAHGGGAAPSSSRCGLGLEGGGVRHRRAGPPSCRRPGPAQTNCLKSAGIGESSAQQPSPAVGAVASARFWWACRTAASSRYSGEVVTVASRFRSPTRSTFALHGLLARETAPLADTTPRAPRCHLGGARLAGAVAFPIGLARGAWSPPVPGVARGQARARGCSPERAAAPLLARRPFGQWTASRSGRRRPGSSAGGRLPTRPLLYP